MLPYRYIYILYNDDYNIENSLLQKVNKVEAHWIL